MATVRKAIFRVKDSSGQYVTTHVQTSADQVLFNDGDNLEQKMEGLQNIGATLIDDTSTNSEKTWSSQEISNQLLTKATIDHGHEISEIEGLVELLSTYLQAGDLEPIQQTLISLRDELAALGGKDDSLEAGLTQAQADIQSAINRINGFIEANGAVVSDLNSLKQEVSTVKSNVGNLNVLDTKEKHSLVLAINELVAKTSNLLQINDTVAVSYAPWSGYKTQNELNNKSDKNHQHGLDSVNDWRTHLYDKTQVDDLLNALALGFTWKTPVDSLDDLPQDAELGWAVIVGGTSLYIYSEEGWIDLGVSSLPPVATQEFDGLLSRVDKAKLDSMDAEKLAQLDLTQFGVLEGKIAQNAEAITNLLGKVGVNEEAITSLRQTLTTHQELLNLIDFDKLEDILLNIDSTTIHQLTTDLAALSGTVSTVSQHVEAVEADLNTQKTRIDSLESLPRIYYQSEEPEGVIPNGTFWIVGE